MSNSPAEDALLTEFGQRVRRRRHELGLSQEDLAEQAGMHRTYVGSIERGERNVALVNIIRLCDALRTSPQDLLHDLHR